MTDYHVFGVRCSNCGWKTSDLPSGEYFTVPHGVPVREAECPTCGCKALAPGLTGISAVPVREPEEAA